MTCAYHAEIENTAFCIKCGKPLCGQCVRQVQGSVYCENCLAESIEGKTAGTKQSAKLPIGGTRPEAAFVLGLIPGVGAIYNAEYFKAALHLLVFGTLVTISDETDVAIFGILAFGFYVYMPFEAYFTAKKRKLAREGIDLETPFDHFNEKLSGFKDREFWGGIALVTAGGLFLLDNFDILRLHQVAKLWPSLLILAGVWLIRRFQEGKKA